MGERNKIKAEKGKQKTTNNNSQIDRKHTSIMVAKKKL